MIRELHDVLRSKTFTNYYCSPLYAFQCNKSRLKARGNSLLEYLLKTNRYRLDQGFNSTGNSGGRFKDVISQVEYKEIQINGENTSSQAPLYRISIDLTTAKNPRSTNEIIFFPSTNTALGGDFYSYPLLLCRGDSQLLLFMREWIQGFFNCTVSRNPVSAKVLRHFITWYSQEMYNVAAEDQEDVYDLLASPGETKLEYYLEGVPDLQHISIKIKAVDLLRLEESVHKSQDHAIDAIERFVLENASVNIGALTLRTVMTTLVALHLDGKIKFMVSASSHFIFSVLQDFTIVMEEKRNQAEPVDDVVPASP